MFTKLRFSSLRTCQPPLSPHTQAILLSNIWAAFWSNSRASHLEFDACYSKNNSESHNESQGEGWGGTWLYFSKLVNIFAQLDIILLFWRCICQKCKLSPKMRVKKRGVSFLCLYLSKLLDIFVQLPIIFF